eukprot:NODE_322_length_11016_cov_0.249061.p2 type:complete len:545 gc:universal NODE_322_length_11016_cov_0.249061:506-2140(+)
MSEEKKAPKREYSTEAGPVKQRKVKDVPFIILFVLMWVGMFIISGLAISKGNIKRLKYGRDYLGNLCGDKNSFALPDGNKVDFDFTTKKYLYFVDVGFVKNPNSICVDACPSYSNTTTVLIKDIIDAQYKKVPAEFQVNSTIPQPYYDVRSTAYRCVPSSSFKYNFNVTQYGKPLFGGSGSADQNEAQDAVMADQGEKNGLSAIWETLENSVGYIAIALLIGTLLSILWLVVIQIFGKFMIWFTLVFTNFAFFGLGAFFLANYSAASKGKAASYSSKAFSSAAQNENVMLGCGITCLSIGVLLLAVTIFMGRRIHLAVDLMSEASIAMRAMPSLMLMPVIKYVLLLGVFAWSLFIMSLLASSGDMIAASVTNGSEKIASKYEPDQVLNYLQIYYLFGTFWTFNFIVAVAETITAGAVAQWYWTLDRKNLPKKIVWDSVVRTLKYHLGSVAIGSLLIAILQTLRAMLSYAQMHSKKAKSIWVKRALSCLSCCLFCFEKALKFLNTNAYIEVISDLFRSQYMVLASVKQPKRHFTCYGEMLLVHWW